MQAISLNHHLGRPPELVQDPKLQHQADRLPILGQHPTPKPGRRPSQNPVLQVPVRIIDHPQLPEHEHLLQFDLDRLR